MRILTLILALLLAANGVAMFVDPPAWYAAVPGVANTGPLNHHFVRDLGVAYFAAGCCISANSSWVIIAM
jgi:hypothetical protein